MPSKLIQLQNDVLVEVEVPVTEAQQLSGSFADKVHAHIDKVKPILTGIVQPILATWNEINQTVLVEQAEIELGLSFESEGNLYITKSKAAANLTIKLVLKAIDSQTDKAP